RMFDHISLSSRDSSEDYAANAEKVGRIQLLFVFNFGGIVLIVFALLTDFPDPQRGSSDQAEAPPEDVSQSAPLHLVRLDTSSRTGKLIMGILALIAEFENDIRRERQMDG